MLNLGQWWIWLLVFLGLVLIGGGGYWYWRSGQQESPAKARRRRRAPRQETAAAFTQEAIYCHQCGKRAGAGDRFCRSCGSRLRTE